MAEQNAKNFKKYYPPHHYVFLPLTFFGFLYFLYQYFTSSHEEYGFYALFMFLLVYLSLMQRQHYALGLQDRLIKQEIRFRYFVLTGKRLENLTPKLSDGQLFSCRYASDEEFVDLVHEAAEKNLGPKEIREKIKVWKADIERV